MIVQGDERGRASRGGRIAVRALAALALGAAAAHLLTAVTEADGDVPVTALIAASLAASAVGTLVHDRDRPGRRRLVVGSGLVALGVGAAALVETATTDATVGPLGALVVLAVGYGVTTLPAAAGHPTGTVCSALAGATSTVLMVELVAHLYAATALTRTWWVGVPLPVAVTGTVLCVALAVARPDRPPLAWVRHGSVHPTVISHLLPAVVLVPVVHRVALALTDGAGASHATAHTVAMLAVSVAVAGPVLLAARAAARAEDDLRTERARLTAVVAALDEGLVVRDADGHVVVANPRASELTRLDFSTDPSLEQIGSEPRFVELDGRLLPFDRMATVRTARTGEPTIGQLLGVRRPDHPDRWLRVSAVPVGERGELGVATTLADVTAERDAVAALAASEERFRLTFETAPVGMAVVSLDGRLLEVNDALVALLGRSRHELLTLDFQSITHPDDLDADLELLASMLAGERDSYTMEKRYVRPDGSPVWTAMHAAMVRDADGIPRYGVGMVVDLTERKALEDVLTHAATHDPLTGLPNRRLVHDRLEVALAERDRRGGHVGVLYCDLDDFKDVNDRFGHAAGDEVLVLLAGRIHECLRAGDTVGRLGGDEFVVVAAGLERPEDLDALADRIIREVARPVPLATGEATTSVSVGAHLAAPGEPAAVLLQLADRAMYRSKRTGRPASTLRPGVPPE